MANSRKHGGKKAARKSPKKRKKSVKHRTGKRDARGHVIQYCTLGKCAKGRMIFGGPKGMATHKRRHHRG